MNPTPERGERMDKNYNIVISDLILNLYDPEGLPQIALTDLLSDILKRLDALEEKMPAREISSGQESQ